MKAEINADGKLIVTAETELEAFALKEWNMRNYEFVVNYDYQQKLTPKTDIA